jgi:hypothetical protein
VRAASDARPEDHVADGTMSLPADDAGLFHHADGKARQIVFARRIHAGHFRGLAADQRAAPQARNRARCPSTTAVGGIERSSLPQAK